MARNKVKLSLSPGPIPGSVPNGEPNGEMAAIWWLVQNAAVNEAHVVACDIQVKCDVQFSDTGWAGHVYFGEIVANYVDSYE